jgi:type VII secretion protein EccB
MASRRDELNAYTFAKRRLTGQFVQPDPAGSEEDAPRPLRAVVPGVIVSVLVLAVSGAWGVFKPVAPQNWDVPGENVIVAGKSTTRYVVLKTDGKAHLHPVLNMSSARLLLDPAKSGVISVSESVLDNGRIPRGATLGIPYAPDRLPGPGDAGAAKRWAVCERPGEDGRAIQQAAFVLAGREQRKTEGAGRLHGGELMYVEGPDRTRYVVDAEGTAYATRKDELLLRQLVGQGSTPQRVSVAWLDTLHKGDTITFPEIEGTPGADARAPGRLEPDANRVGMILRAADGIRNQQYLVLPGRVAPISDFVAKLLLNSRELIGLGQDGHATSVSGATIRPGQGFGQGKHWPDNAPDPVNSATASSRSTLCNVLRAVDGHNGSTTLSTWAGTGFPATAGGSGSAYVTPGSGQLFRQFQGSGTGSGFVFLVTDTGLRYGMQSHSDTAVNDAGTGSAGSDEQQGRQGEPQQAQNRLGYHDVHPAPIPAAWASFLPAGPRLSTEAARRPQGS